ncbi:hypothetical protein [Coleofasciculus sp. H7-2]|uniref:hypothetical protein n=1 Tax=Coleofasciculus sp. H7-2 TaxID=3351545 RepID=UPI00366E88C9
MGQFPEAIANASKRAELNTTCYLGNLGLDKISQSLITILNQRIPVVVVCAYRLITKAPEVIGEKKDSGNPKSAFPSVHLEKDDRDLGSSTCLPTVASF